MDNLLIIGIYTPFAMITAIIFLIEIFRHFKRHEDYLFTLLCFCAVCWFASNIAGLLTNNIEAAKFFIDFILIFVGFIPPILLLFVLEFYKVPYKPTTAILVLLLLIPTINIVMVLTSEYHSLINTQLEIISLSPVREVSHIWGPWFWVHTAYCYIISITLIIVIMVRHFRLPRFFRTPSTLMVTGVSFTLLGNIITLLQILPPAMDPTLITMSLSLILFNLAIINNNNSKFVRFSQAQIYHYLKEYLLILDENRRVVDHNRPALNWFSSHKIHLDSCTLEDVIDTLLHNGKQKSLEIENSTDIYFHGGHFPIVLNLCEHEMTDAKGDKIGSIAVFSDVTQNRMLIEKLETKAGMDSLTGLANRMAYEGARKRLDAPEHLPLGVIVCDANGLKHVNDTLGHIYGDMMLQTVAEILENACPKPGFIARIGGDEFIYLLSRTEHDDSVVLMEQIKDITCNLENLPFAVSVALGAATKYSPDENLDDVIALADKRMYEAKKEMKKQLVK